jgi:hypothetical protein
MKTGAEKLAHRCEAKDDEGNHFKLTTETFAVEHLITS